MESADKNTVVDDHIRRWEFHSKRPGREKNSNLQMPFVGRKGEADRMCAFIRKRYQEQVEIHKEIPALDIYTVPCEEVSEDVKLIFDALTNEAAAGMEAVRMLSNVICEDDPLPEKIATFERLMSSGRSSVEEDDRLTVLFKIGRDRYIAPTMATIKDAIKRVTGRDDVDMNDVHIHVVGADMSGLPPVVKAILSSDEDKKNWH